MTRADVNRIIESIHQPVKSRTLHHLSSIMICALTMSHTHAAEPAKLPRASWSGIGSATPTLSSKMISRAGRTAGCRISWMKSRSRRTARSSPAASGMKAGTALGFTKMDARPISVNFIGMWRCFSGMSGSQAFSCR